MSDPIEPFTPAELAHHRALADKGETPTLEIVRRFVHTIRTKFSASPTAVAKGKKTRTVAPKVNEDQIDFF